MGIVYWWIKALSWNHLKKKITIFPFWHYQYLTALQNIKNHPGLLLLFFSYKTKLQNIRFFSKLTRKKNQNQLQCHLMPGHLNSTKIRLRLQLTSGHSSVDYMKWKAVFGWEAHEVHAMLHILAKLRAQMDGLLQAIPWAPAALKVSDGTTLTLYMTTSSQDFRLAGFFLYLGL